jgi:D-methionine transport system permease protein
MTAETWTLLYTLVPIELLNTLYMVGAASFAAFLLGFPLGILLTVTAPGHIWEHKWIHRCIGLIVNTGRSFPFAILMVALIPFTRLLVGTSIGTTAAIVPLALAAAPFLARMTELALQEVETGLVEAALVMGSTPLQIIHKVLLCEALPGLILGVTATVINLIGYSAMAGMMGGGGLGKVAIQHGYQRFNPEIMAITVVLLIILVQAVQAIGNRLTSTIQQRRGKGA